MESSKVQLRLQLLASETGLPESPDVNTMSAFAAQSRMQHPGMPPQHYSPNSMPMGPQNTAAYSNHDLITPVLQSAHPSGASSRKASMNSMSMQRLFRRKGTLGGNFDEDTGADIGDISNAEMSFNDIAHLRGAGRYNTSAMGNLDTAPIIPVVGAPGSASAKSLNNVQYRKYMNHQKKLNLAQSARANSLAGGGNPMMQQDPRSMSFTNAPNSRTNSLGTSMNGMGGPNFRAMSLNSNAMFRGPPMAAPGYGPPGGQRMNGQYMQPQNGLFQNGQFQNGPVPSRPSPNGQHLGSFGGRQGGHVSPQMQMNGPGSPQNFLGNPHTLSLRTGASPNYRNGPHDPRSNSFNGMSMAPAQGMYGTSTHPMNNSTYLHVNQMNSGYVPGMSPAFHQQNNGPRHQLNGSGQPQNIPAQRNQILTATETSTDSLMNVLEEEEDEDLGKGLLNQKSSQSRFTLGTSANTSLPLSDLNSDDDHVYTFDDQDSPQISRKSTVKKSNSMRVRKLDLFNTQSKGSLDPGSIHDDTFSKSSPHGNNELSKFKNSRSLYSISDNAVDGEDESSDAGLREIAPGSLPDSEPTEVTATESNDSNIASESSHKQDPIKLKSLTKNTVYRMFRKSSAMSQEKLDQSPASSVLDNTLERAAETLSGEVSADPERRMGDSRDHGFSESRSNFSSYSTDSPKQTETNTTQDSISSIHDRFSDLKVHGGTQATAYDQQEQGSRSAVNNRSVDLDSSSASGLAFQPSTVKRISSMSRSNSELKMKGLVPKSALLHANAVENSVPFFDQDKKDVKKTISLKSVNLMKRFSFSNSRRVAADDTENEEQDLSKRIPSSSSSTQNQFRPLAFTKEELAIMTCNQELQSELQLVTSELATSIKREIALEAQIKSKSGFQEGPESKKSLNKELERARVISDLQEKLNKERKLRFISEEHAILAEHGQTPSALKLDYEKNEIYNQLLAKNDLVIQLQDKLDEIAAAENKNSGNDLVSKFNDLLKENADLKAKLEKSEAVAKTTFGASSGEANLEADYFYHDFDQAQIMSLKNQRDELREMITKLTSSQNFELKVAQEKIKVLETKLEKVNSINSKLSKRMEKPANSIGASNHTGGLGGKLQGFSIIAPSKKLFDD